MLSDARLAKGDLGASGRLRGRPASHGRRWLLRRQQRRQASHRRLARCPATVGHGSRGVPHAASDLA